MTMGYPFKLHTEDKDNQVTTASLWRGFESSTTVHGIPHVAAATGKSKTFFWLLVSLAALGMLTYHMYTICSLYFSYNVSVKITILEERAMNFPAITFCNINPIKKSKIGLDEVIESLLGDDNTIRKRRKRYTDTSSPCTSTDLLNDELGLCFRLFNDTRRRLTGGGHAVETCSTLGGAVYYPSSQSRIDFMNNADFFFISGVDTYWNWMQGDAWANVYDISASGSYTNWGTKDTSLDSSVSVVSDNHRWLSKKRDDNNDLHFTLCQDMVQCPHPVYDPDGDGLGFCWMRPFGDALNAWDQSQSICPLYDPDAYLIELDSQEKTDHFVNVSGILDGTLQDSYWLNFKKSVWESDGRTATWTNFAPNPTLYFSDSEPALASISLDHKWMHGKKNDVLQSSGMVICEMPNLQYVPPTNTESTDNIQITTDPATTYAETTEWSTEHAETTEVTTEYAKTTERSTEYAETTEITSEYGKTTSMTTEYAETTEMTTESVDTTEKSTEYADTTEKSTEYAETTEKSTEYMTSQEVTLSETVKDITVLTTNNQETSNVHQTTEFGSTPSIASETTSTENIESTTKTTQMVTDSTSIAGYAPLKQHLILQETVIENMALISEQVKESMGYTAYEFVVDCTYEGRDCTHDLFQQFYSPALGNCYIFNSGWNSSVPLLKSRKTGRRYGLSVILNIGESEYVEKLGGSSGARILPTGQNEMPHPEEQGIFVEPGKLISISLRKVILQRMPDPYGNCTNIKNDYQTDVFSERYPVKYTVKNCKKTCYQKHVIDICRCGDSHYPMNGMAFGQKPAPPCDVNNITQEICKNKVNSDFIEGKFDCEEKCPHICSEHYFTHDISLAKWPSITHMDKYIKDLQSKINGYNLSEENFMERNLITVEIFFDDFSYEKIEEIPAYNTGQFASDIGGILGLWVGMSVITAFEFIELLIDIFAMLILKVFYRNDNYSMNSMDKYNKTDVVPITVKSHDGIGIESSNHMKTKNNKHIKGERSRTDSQRILTSVESTAIHW